MLYSNNQEKELSLELFKNPTSEYRGAPFWSWNCKVEEDELLRQIDILKEMGMGGFHIHSRSGMDTEYLGEKFMNLVKACDEKAKQEGLLCWLYDEDRWPSGSAGGIVTKNPIYRARYLVFTPFEYKAVENAGSIFGHSEGRKTGKGYLLARYQITLNDGYLVQYSRLNEDDKIADGAKIWSAYLEIATDNPWFNNQAYVNTLDRAAIEKFLQVTHERYYEILKDDFGKSIPAIFTDEPQFSHKQTLGYANEERDIIIPFTDDFPQTFKKAYNRDILDCIPELIWELPCGEISQIRYWFHDHMAERFSSAYADTVGKWCESHKIMLTGHLMMEDTLYSQTLALGEAMRSYRSFQLPGIDILCDRREYTTAKQAQSAARQYGWPGVLSELYGVTNWDFDFRGHKLQGDWQAALGVTVRVPHLSWVSMGGEAKRDYPASINYQSPWYKEYPYIEDHFSRINTALTRGKPICRIGVIHPVESYWLYWGPKEQTSHIRQELDLNFSNITNWLLFNLLDFDFISESLLPSQNSGEQTSSFQVGAMNYEVLVIPGCVTLRSTTVERLEAFSKAGGKIIFVGNIPEYVDAVLSDKVRNLAQHCEFVPFQETKVIQSLENFREVDIIKEDGTRTDNLFYQMREDNSKVWLFICHSVAPNNRDVIEQECIRIKIKGCWKPVLYDTLSGQTKIIEADTEGTDTIIPYGFYAHDSLLICLEQGKSGMNIEKNVQKPSSKVILEFPYENEFELSELNVLLLDMAEFSFDNGKRNTFEEILRIDNKFRKYLGFPLRSAALAQPWVTNEEENVKHILKLRFIINSEVDVENPMLALENATDTIIIVNGSCVESKISGWYVDRSINVIKIPPIYAGKNEIALEIPFGKKTVVENCYLLGNFGVRVEGRETKIINLPKKLKFGDFTNQGLPFYGGNIKYKCFINSPGQIMRLKASHFRSPLICVALDGIMKGRAAFAPYEVELGYIPKGDHVIELTAFGNRVNTFGALHNSNFNENYFGPNAWRTSGDSWSYEYQIKPSGITVTPKLTGY